MSKLSRDVLENIHLSRHGETKAIRRDADAVLSLYRDEYLITLCERVAELEGLLTQINQADLMRKEEDEPMWEEKNNG